MSSAARMKIEVVVGLNLQRLRQARDMSQLALSTESKVGQNYISNIENGKRSPSVGVLDKLAHALKAPVTEFFVAPSPRRRK
ncbi:MAG TPA: helix-turn-helix transcriptional regulator [Alphaproteobacteria bacterium]|jgi:transcriptional regulator with XRE-family HTH domain